MAVHRFLHLVTTTRRPSADAAASAAFVPCPAGVLVAVPVAQQEYIREVYRVARAEAERVARPFALPEFSFN